jgi:hypothetical protein
MRLPSVPGPRDVLALAEKAGDAVDQLLAVVPRVGQLLGDVESLVGEIRGLVRRIEETRVSVEDVIARVDLPLDRVTKLVDALEPSLLTLQPTLQRLADTTTPDEVDALVGLVDQLPGLVLSLERDVVPVLGTLGSVAPDLHDLLETSRELNDVLVKVPGMGFLKRKVEEDQAAEEE